MIVCSVTSASAILELDLNIKVASLPAQMQTKFAHKKLIAKAGSNVYKLTKCVIRHFHTADYPCCWWRIFRKENVKARVWLDVTLLRDGDPCQS